MSTFPVTRTHSWLHIGPGHPILMPHSSFLLLFFLNRHTMSTRPRPREATEPDRQKSQSPKAGGGIYSISTSGHRNQMRLRPARMLLDGTPFARRRVTSLTSANRKGAARRTCPEAAGGPMASSAGLALCAQTLVVRGGSRFLAFSTTGR